MSQSPIPKLVDREPKTGEGWVTSRVWKVWCESCQEGYQGTRNDAETWEMYHEAERHEA